MDRLEKIVDLLGKSNKLLLIIAGIDKEVVDGYAGEQISTDPERLDRIRFMFDCYKIACQEYDIVKLPEELSDCISILATSGTINKMDLLRLISSKFTSFYDDQKDYGAFYDVCTILEEYSIADSTVLFMHGIKQFMDTISVVFSEEIKNIESSKQSDEVASDKDVNNDSSGVKMYEYDIDYLNFLFTEDEVSFKGVQYNTLVNAVATADFRALYLTWASNKRKTYVGGILRFISKGILRNEQKEWLAAASKSIGISKYAGSTRINDAYDKWVFILTNKIRRSSKFKDYVDSDRC